MISAYLPFSRAVLRSVWMASVRETATISARWFIFTDAPVMRTERSANSDFFSTTDSVPAKLYS